MNADFESDLARALHRHADAIGVEDLRSGTAVTRDASPGPAATRRRYAVAVVAIGIIGAAVALGLTRDDNDSDVDVIQAPETSEPMPTTTIPPTTSAPDTDQTSEFIPGTNIVSLDLELLVTPDADLEDGDEVAFAASGFTPGLELGLVQCLRRVPTGGRDDCDVSTVVFVTANDQGAINGVFPVRRFINLPSGPIDCALATAEEPCGIGVGNPEKLEESGGAPLHFAADAEGERPPRITLDPPQPEVLLTHGQRVTVTGSGFVPGESMWLIECGIPSRGDATCFVGATRIAPVVADETGSFTTTIPLFRLVGSGENEIDCADKVGACVLAMEAQRSPNVTSLAFDAADTTPPSRSVVVDTPADVAPGDTLTVTIQGMGEGPVIAEFCDTIDAGCLVAGESELVDGGAVVTVTLPPGEIDADGVNGCSSWGCALSLSGPGLPTISVSIPFGPTTLAVVETFLIEELPPSGDGGPAGDGTMADDTSAAE